MLSYSHFCENVPLFTTVLVQASRYRLKFKNHEKMDQNILIFLLVYIRDKLVELMRVHRHEKHGGT